MEEASRIRGTSRIRRSAELHQGRLGSAETRDWRHSGFTRGRQAGIRTGLSGSQADGGKADVS